MGLMRGNHYLFCHPGWKRKRSNPLHWPRSNQEHLKYNLSGIQCEISIQPVDEASNASVANPLMLFSAKENNYVQFYPFERVRCFSVAIHFLGAVSPIPCWFSIIEGFLINPWYSSYFILWIWSNLQFLWLHPHRPPCDSFDTTSMEPHVPFLPSEFSCPMWFPPHCPLPGSPWSLESFPGLPTGPFAAVCSFSQPYFFLYHLTL